MVVVTAEGRWAALTGIITVGIVGAHGPCISPSWALVGRVPLEFLGAERSKEGRFPR